MSKDNLESSIYAEFYNMENLPFEKNLPVDALCKTTQFTDILTRLQYASDNCPSLSKNITKSPSLALISTIICDPKQAANLILSALGKLLTFTSFPIRA